jgi:hypothetical protein
MLTCFKEMLPAKDLQSSQSTFDDFLEKEAEKLLGK